MKKTSRRVAKRLVAWRFRHYRLGAEPARWTRVAGFRLRVLPDVFNPGFYFTSPYLATYLGRPGVVPPGARVLDLGTGSGIAALAAARAGAGTVVATDISPAAVRCVAGNIRRNGLVGRITVRQGDLFAPVAGERFDRIICNPPYFPGTPHTLAEQTLYAGPAYEWLDRFARDAIAHLAPGGRIILVLGDATDLSAIRARLAAPGWRIREAGRRDILVEVLYIVELTWPGAPSPAAQGAALEEATDDYSV